MRNILLTQNSNILKSNNLSKYLFILLISGNLWILPIEWCAYMIHGYGIGGRARRSSHFTRSHPLGRTAHTARSSLPLLFIMHNADRHGHFIYRRNTRTLGSTIHRRPFLAPSPAPLLERAIPLLSTRSHPAVHGRDKDNAHATQQRKELYVLSVFSFPVFSKGCPLARGRTYSNELGSRTRGNRMVS